MCIYCYVASELKFTPRPLHNCCNGRPPRKLLFYIKCNLNLGIILIQNNNNNSLASNRATAAVQCSDTHTHTHTHTSMCTRLREEEREVGLVPDQPFIKRQSEERRTRVTRGECQLECNMNQVFICSCMNTTEDCKRGRRDMGRLKGMQVDIEVERERNLKGGRAVGRQRW